MLQWKRSFELRLRLFHMIHLDLFSEYHQQQQFLFQHSAEVTKNAPSTLLHYTMVYRHYRKKIETKSLIALFLVRPKRNRSWKKLT